MNLIKNITRLPDNASFKTLLANGFIAVAGLLLYTFSLRWTMGYTQERFKLTLAVMVPVAFVMTAMILTFIFIMMRPFQHYIDRLKANKPFDEKLYFKARRVSLNLAKLLIFFYVIFFTVGPSIGFIFSPESFIDQINKLIVCASMGFVSGIFAMFVSNILLAKDKLKLRMTRINRERNEKDLKLRSKSFIMVLSIFLLVFTYTFFTGYHESLKARKLQTLLEKPSMTLQEKQIVLEEAVYSRSEFMGFISIYGSILALLSLGMWFLYSKEQVGQLKILKKRIIDILEGDKDLTRKLNLLYFDEVGELAMLMNQFIENIRKMFHEIKSVFGDVQSSGTMMEDNSKNSMRIMTEMSSSLSEVNGIIQRQASLVGRSDKILNDVIDSFQSVADNVEKQSANMHSTSSTVEEVASNISSVTNSSSLADNLAKELNQAAQDGNQAVEDSVESITLVENFSNNVEEIITVITSIAKQTDMLAMNAAIEAAHAEDYGKGFAVVADEIRKLAENSETSAKEIVSQIEEMGKNIRKSVDLSILAGDSLGKIVDGVKQTSHLIREISFAMVEQNVATQNIHKATSELVESNDLIRKYTDQEKSANQEVINAMKELVVVTDEVLTIIQNQNSLSKQIIENVEEVDNSLKRNKQALLNYSRLIEEFKI